MKIILVITLLKKQKKAHKVLESLFKKIFDINWSLIKEVIYGDKEK